MKSRVDFGPQRVKPGNAMAAVQRRAFQSAARSSSAEEGLLRARTNIATRPVETPAFEYCEEHNDRRAAGLKRRRASAIAGPMKLVTRRRTIFYPSIADLLPREREKVARLLWILPPLLFARRNEYADVIYLLEFGRREIFQARTTPFGARV